MVSEAEATWEKAKLAFLKFGILVAFMLLHWGLSSLIHKVAHGWAAVEELLHAFFMLAFSMIYVDGLWEVLGIFVPRLERWRRAIVEGNIRSRESGHGN